MAEKQAPEKTRLLGKKAPEFSLEANDGTTYSLSQFLGKKNVILVFYCMNDTPG